jgi:hypothetical protein
MGKPQEREWEKACQKCGWFGGALSPTTFTVTYEKHPITEEERLRLACRRCGYAYTMPCLDAKEVR